MSRERTDLFAWLTFIAIGTFLMWAWRHHTAYDWSWDETVIILTSREVARGVSLYDPIWWNYPPLLFWELGSLFRIFGERVDVARALAVFWSTVTLLSTALVTRRLANWREAFLAVLLLLGTPVFVRDSRTVQADMPAAACGLLALWVALAGDRFRFAPLAAGLMWGGALMTKPTAVPFGVALAIAVWGKREKRLERLGLVALGTALVFLVVLAAVPVRAFIEQVVLFNIGGSGQADLWANGRTIWAILSGGRLWRAGLLVAGGVGWTFAWQEGNAQRFVLVVLSAPLVLFLALFLPYPDLFTHIVLIMVPLVCAWLAIGTCALLDCVRRPRARLFFLNLLPVLVLLLDKTPWFWQEYAVGDMDDKRRDALEYAQRWRTELPSETTIFSDDPMLIFLSGHPVPPALVNVASRRWQRDGELDGTALVDLVARERPDLIVFWTDRLLEVPGFLEWVQSAGYELLATHAHGKRRIYARAEEYRSQTAPLFDGLELRGFVVPTSARAGEVITVRLLVEATQEWAGERRLVAEIKGEERNVGLLDIPITPPGDLLPGDEFAIVASPPLEADAPPGRYRLHVRIYDPRSGRSGSDTVLFTPLEVQSP